MDPIILGKGIFSIGDKDIAATKGGGQFVVEREYRNIEADGDRGTVKGRVVLDKSEPKLTINALTMLETDMNSYYPGLKVESIPEAESTPASTKVSGTLEISDEDYKEVKWTGRTKAGKAVIITLNNAINLENIDWSLVDKEEVIQKLTFVGTYDEENKEKEPWSVDWV